MIQIIIATIFNLFLLNGIGWAGACEEKCRNAAFDSSGQFWTAVRNSDNTIIVSVNGTPIGSQPGGATPANLALQSFGGQVFLVVKGVDIPPGTAYGGVWFNRWTGSGWTGWVNDGLTVNSPGMVVFSSTLFLDVAGSDNGMWVNRYTTNWLGWQGLGGFLRDALACATDPSEIRVGGEGSDPQCYRRTSTDGVNWTGWVVAPPCP